MASVRMDRDFEVTRFVALGVELSRRAEGFAVTGLAAQSVQGRGWQPQWRILAHVSAPSAEPAPSVSDDATVWASSVGDALALVERKLVPTHHVLVVRQIGTVTSTVWAERASCPRLASLVTWDALRLAQLACPWIAEPSEAALADALAVRLPRREAGAAQAVLATSQICQRAIERGAMDGRWTTLRQVEEQAGRAPRQVEEYLFRRGPEQIELF